MRLLMLMIAKTHALELRVKGSRKGEPHHFTIDELSAGVHKFPGGHLTRAIGHDIAQGLWNLRQAVSEDHGDNLDAWQRALDSEVRTALQRLSSLIEDVDQDNANELPQYPQLWLAIAALHVAGVCTNAILGGGDVPCEEADLLTSEKAFKQSNEWACALLSDREPVSGENLASLCFNCGWSTEKVAKLQCEECGSVEGLLCEDCDKILHLSRNRHGHKRAVIDDSAQLESRGGMMRVKLPTLTLTVDVRKHKAILELQVQSQHHGSLCRFCAQPITEASRAPDVGCPAFDGLICNSSACLDLRELACSRTLPCGHACAGVRGEEVCPPCLTCGNDADGEISPLNVIGEDLCSYCFDTLNAEPCVVLDCQHVFHFQCLKRMLEARWSGARIDFGFRNCPVCRQAISHSTLVEVLEPIIKLEEDVKQKALMRLEYEGLAQCQDIVSPGGEFDGDPQGYSMHKFAYFLCYNCNKPYFGGAANCGVNADFDPSELVCGPCSNPQMSSCQKHGDDYLEYKCRFCCSVAVWFCFGTTHFCDACHNQPGVGPRQEKAGELPACPAGPLGKQLEGSCPLRVPHPPTGEEFPLGCGICRNTQTF